MGYRARDRRRCHRAGEEIVTPRQILTIETAADIAMRVVEYLCYVIIFWTIGIGWILT